MIHSDQHSFPSGVGGILPPQLKWDMLFIRNLKSGGGEPLLYHLKDVTFII